MTLGGGRSIRLSYWGVYEIELWTYRLWLKGGRFVVTLGGVCSIQLSYWDIYFYRIILAVF